MINCNLKYVKRICSTFEQHLYIFVANVTKERLRWNVSDAFMVGMELRVAVDRYIREENKDLFEEEIPF